MQGWRRSSGWCADDGKGIDGIGRFADINPSPKRPLRVSLLHPKAPEQPFIGRRSPSKEGRSTGNTHASLPLLDFNSVQTPGEDRCEVPERRRPSFF
jgi:hypothetical protein